MFNQFFHSYKVFKASAVYYVLNSTGFMIPYIKQLRIMSFGVFLSACVWNGGKNRTNIEVLQDMMQQISIKAQEGDKAGNLQMHHPPANTRARNHIYYPYKGQPKLAEKNLKNPFQGQFSPSIIGLGKRHYEKTCIVCHGNKGDGHGLAAPKMAVPPPSLLSRKVMEHSDGRIYHIIHEGQGLMGSYHKQVPREKDKWALVNYIRMLQKKAIQQKLEK